MVVSSKLARYAPLELSLARHLCSSSQLLQLYLVPKNAGTAGNARYDWGPYTANETKTFADRNAIEFVPMQVSFNLCSTVADHDLVTSMPAVMHVILQHLSRSAKIIGSDNLTSFSAPS